LSLTGKEKKILVIDPESGVAEGIRAALAAELGEGEARVLATAQAEAGLQKVRAERWDVVFSVIALGGPDGFEVCRRIRKLQPRASVILLSTYQAGRDDALQAWAAGAEAYLAKPLKPGEIRYVLRTVFKVADLNHALYEKNRQLETSLGQLKNFHKNLASLNNELRSDKKRLAANLKDMEELNRQLEDKNAQISSMIEELSGRFDSTEALLASIIELHQSGHRGHSERVARLSVAIAEKMKLRNYQIRNIRTAARLHELGIVALPTEALRQEALDERKNRKYNTHPMVGEMLLKGFPGFELVADILRHLHENVDGSGTPDGLYGEQIPVGSRIISAASYLDHSRVAQPSESVAVLIARMLSQSGKLFDEQVLAWLRECVEAEAPGKKKEALECSVFALSEGMELASDLYSESGINILRKGTVLDTEIVNKVLKFHTVDPIKGPIKVCHPS
jgi:response regulator RpfG family c-di-GMP phosphodiesterase